MFSDKFMHKSVAQCNHPDPATVKAAIAQIPKRKSAPKKHSEQVNHEQLFNSHHHKLSLHRQQSLSPSSTSDRSTVQIKKKLVLSHSLAAPRTALERPCQQRQQSIPSKGSPKPYLLEECHTVCSVPPIITHARTGSLRSFAKTSSIPRQGGNKRERSLPVVENHRSCTSAYNFEKMKTRKSNERTHHMQSRSLDVQLRMSSSLSGGGLCKSHDSITLDAAHTSLSAQGFSRRNLRMMGGATMRDDGVYSGKEGVACELVEQGDLSHHTDLERALISEGEYILIQRMYDVCAYLL